MRVRCGFQRSKRRLRRSSLLDLRNSPPASSQNCPSEGSAHTPVPASQRLTESPPATLAVAKNETEQNRCRFRRKSRSRKAEFGGSRLRASLEALLLDRSEKAFPSRFALPAKFEPLHKRFGKAGFSHTRLYRADFVGHAPKFHSAVGKIGNGK